MIYDQDKAVEAREKQYIRKARIEEEKISQDELRIFGL